MLTAEKAAAFRALFLRIPTKNAKKVGFNPKNASQKS